MQSRRCLRGITARNSDAQDGNGGFCLCEQKGATHEIRFYKSPKLAR